MATTLEQEQTAFEAGLSALLPEHAGEYVVFKDEAPVAFYATFHDAYEGAIALFGPDAVFLVSEVVESTPGLTSLSWQLGVL